MPDRTQQRQAQSIYVQRLPAGRAAHVPADAEGAHDDEDEEQPPDLAQHGSDGQQHLCDQRESLLEFLEESGELGDQEADDEGDGADRHRDEDRGIEQC